jgi:hypothetical protein
VIAIPIPLALLGTLAGLWLLAGLLARHLQGLVLLLTRSGHTASMFYDLLVFPGVIVHEVAHLVAAILLRVRILRADLFRFRRAGDLRQGEVVVQRVDPLRMSLIGAAPLLLGAPLVLWLVWILPIPPLGLNWDIYDVLRPVSYDPVHLLGLYLVWAVANTMFPSPADRAAWWVIWVALAVAFVLALLTGQRPALPASTQAALLMMAAQLTSGLLPVLVLDLLLLAVVVCLEWVAGQVTGRRVARR